MYGRHFQARVLCLVLALFPMLCQADFQKAKSAYLNGKPGVYLSELQGIYREHRDDEALSWVRAICYISCSVGLNSLKPEHQIATAASLQPAIERAGQPEFYFKLGLIWQAAGDLREALPWMRKAAESNYLNDGCCEAPHFSKQVYAKSLLIVGDADGARYWFESSVTDGDAESERILISAYYYGLNTMPNLNVAATAISGWKVNPPRAAQLRMNLANRILLDGKASAQDKCRAVGIFIEISMGWGSLNPKDPDKALALAEKQISMPECKRTGEQNRLTAILQGAGPYTSAEREQLWQNRPPPVASPVDNIVH